MAFLRKHKRFFKKYKALFYGFGLTLGIAIFLKIIGVLILTSESFLNNIGEVSLFFITWFLLFSLLIYTFSALKRYVLKIRRLLLKLIGLFLLFIVAMIINESMLILHNPITVSLVTIVILGGFYVLFPSFFKKYKFLIFGIYLIDLLSFYYVRIFTETLSHPENEGVIYVMFFLPIPLLFGLWVYEQWKWLKNLQVEKTNAELALLKAQINPHFFFNTLNNLYSLTVNHSEKAPKVILKLSEMMRYTIYEGKNETVSLKKEIDYLQNYIDLHKIRYQKKVDINFSHKILSEKDTVTPLLFIILLENAFKHGVETQSDNAFIKMHLESDDKAIIFTIENNFDAAEIPEENGIGLENLKHRLKLIYPNKHEFNISEKDSVCKVNLIIKKS